MIIILIMHHESLNHSALIKSEIDKIVSKLGNQADLTISVTPPTQTGFGDLTTNFALVNFKQLKSSLNVSSPRVLADWLVKQLTPLTQTSDALKFITKVEVAGNGFVNFYFSEQYLLSHLFVLIKQKSIKDSLKQKRTQKVMVEFTDPNPFKELHIGHAYSNTVGEAISRGYEALGHDVRRVCYQGDVGMHVAKTLWGWFKLKKEPEELEELSLDQQVAFLGQAYAKGAQAYKLDDQAKEEMKQLNYLVFIAAQERLEEETGWQPKVNYKQYLDKASKFDYQKVKKMYFVGRGWSLQVFEVQYQRLGTKFDQYFFESQVGEVGYEIVKKFLARGVFMESEGAIIFPGEKYGLHNRVFINSLGLPTYEAKELGLAPTKYEYFPHDLSIIVTANEIDEYFKVLLKALELTLPELAKKTKHISHGMVKLTTGKMSSRTGQVVRAKDGLDELEKLAFETLSQRENLSEAEKKQIATKLATAAVKFGFLRIGLGADIVFDLKQAVSFTGESGPYLLYSYVRTQSIWRKLNDQFGLNKSLLIDTIVNSKDELLQPGINDIETKEIDLLRKLNQYLDIVKQAVVENKPHLVANYLFSLAQIFSSFYEAVPILTQLTIKSEKLKVRDLPEATQRRLLLTESVGQVIKHGLWLLGIETVERM